MKGIDAEAEVASMSDASKLGQWSAPDEHGCRHLLTDADRLADVVWQMCDEMGYPRTTDSALRLPGAMQNGPRHARCCTCGPRPQLDRRAEKRLRNGYQDAWRLTGREPTTEEDR